MRAGLKPFVVAALVAVGSVALAACALQLPDGTGQEWWLQDMNNPARYD